MDGFLKILPIFIPPIPLTEADRQEFSDAQYVVNLWPAKQKQYFKSVKAKKRATTETHNVRIKTLLLNTTKAAQNTLNEGRDLGIWPERLRESTPAPGAAPRQISHHPAHALTGARMPLHPETEEQKAKRLERRREEMREYDRRMAEREAQEDRDERDRERRIEAHRMSQIRAEQLKTKVFPQSRLLRPDREGIRMKWERRPVKC